MDYFEDMTFAEQAEYVSEELTAYLEPYNSDDEIREVPCGVLVEARMVIEGFQAEARRLKRIYRGKARPRPAEEDY